MILNVFTFLAPALIFSLRRRIILHLRVVSLLIFLCHFVETFLLDVRHSLRHMRYSANVALAFLVGVTDRATCDKCSIIEKISVSRPVQHILSSTVACMRDNEYFKRLIL